MWKRELGRQDIRVGSLQLTIHFWHWKLVGKTQLQQSTQFCAYIKQSLLVHVFHTITLDAHKWLPQKMKHPHRRYLVQSAHFHPLVASPLVWVTGVLSFTEVLFSPMSFLSLKSTLSLLCFLQKYLIRNTDICKLAAWYHCKNILVTSTIHILVISVTCLLCTWHVTNFKGWFQFDWKLKCSWDASPFC